MDAREWDGFNWPIKYIYINKKGTRGFTQGWKEKDMHTLSTRDLLGWKGKDVHICSGWRRNKCCRKVFAYRKSLDCSWLIRMVLGTSVEVVGTDFSWLSLGLERIHSKWGKKGFFSQSGTFNLKALNIFLLLLKLQIPNR